MHKPRRLLAGVALLGACLVIGPDGNRLGWAHTKRALSIAAAVAVCVAFTSIILPRR